MAARSNQRRRRRRSRLGFLFRLLAAVFLIVAIVFGATVFFQVQSVIINGNSRYTADEVVAASGIETGENLFLLNKNRTAQEIREKLPYIQTVSLRRMLPDAIVITVTEWDAVAQIEGEGTPWLISVGGKLLENGTRPNVISVTGLTALSPRAGTTLAVAQAEQDRLVSLLQLLAAASAQGNLEHLRAIDLSGGEVLVRYGERFTVKLPFGADYAYKMLALETALEDIAAKRSDTETGTLDLTREDYTVVYLPDGPST